MKALLNFEHEYVPKRGEADWASIERGGKLVTRTNPDFTRHPGDAQCLPLPPLPLLKRFVSFHLVHCVVCEGEFVLVSDGAAVHISTTLIMFIADTMCVLVTVAAFGGRLR